MGNPQFAERISSNPNAFVFGVIVWLPIAVSIVTLMNWIVSGEVDTIEGLCAIFLLIFLGILTVMPGQDWMSVLTFSTVFVLMLGYPMMKVLQNKVALKQIDAEVIENACKHLDERPSDYMKMLYLARQLAFMALKGNAIGMCERGLSLAPPNLPLDERGDVKGWRAYAQPSELELVRCTHCGETPPASEWKCICGAHHLTAKAKGAWDTSVIPKKLFVAVGIGVVVLVVVTIAANSGTNAAIIGIPLALLLGGLGIWRAMKSGAAQSSA